MQSRVRNTDDAHGSSQPRLIDDSHDIQAIDISDVAWILVIEKEVCRYSTAVITIDDA